MMERLATCSLFRLKHFHKMTEKESCVFYQDEIAVGKKAYEESEYITDILGYKIPYETSLKIQQRFTDYNKAVVMEPFFRLGDGVKVYFPVSTLDVFYGTNGMSFGNDENEARMQAVSEVWERYVNKQVILKEYALPEIPIAKEYMDEVLVEKIKSFMEDERYTLKIMDASLEQGYPVACAMLTENSTGKYFVKFGAHFDRNVAIERCLTEMFQGRSFSHLDFLKEPVYLDAPEWQRRNLEFNLHSGDGFYPKAFYEKEKADFTCQEWPVFSDNKTAADYYEKKLCEHADGVYYKTVQTEAGVVVRYLAKGISELYEAVQDKIDWENKIQKVSDCFRHFTSASVEELKEVCDIIRANCGTPYDTVIPFIPHNLPSGGRFHYLNLILLEFIQYVRAGDCENAERVTLEYRTDSRRENNIAEAMDKVLHFMKEADCPEEFLKLSNVIPQKLFYLDQLEHGCIEDICLCGNVEENYRKVKERAYETYR